MKSQYFNRYDISIHRPDEFTRGVIKSSVSDTGAWMLAVDGQFLEYKIEELEIKLRKANERIRTLEHSQDSS